MVYETAQGLFRAGRPSTGLYAFLLSLVSFRFFAWNEWHSGIVIALVFALITMSIMRFNDLIDRHNDVRKGKFFATTHASVYALCFTGEALVIIGSLVFIAVYSVHSAVFMAGVWAVGLAYSFVPHWYRIQNIIVAVCSGTPALSASVYFGALEPSGAYSFLVFVALIWVSEVNKDLDDVQTDVGYKRTFPTEMGFTQTVFMLVASLHMVGALCFKHPIAMFQVIAVTLLPYLAWTQVPVLLDSRHLMRTYRAINVMIAGIGVVLYVG